MNDACEEQNIQEETKSFSSSKLKQSSIVRQKTGRLSTMNDTLVKAPSNGFEEESKANLKADPTIHEQYSPDFEKDLEESLKPQTKPSNQVDQEIAESYGI